MDADGSHVRTLPTILRSRGAAPPSFAPDGKRFVYTGTGTRGIQVATLDRTRQRGLRSGQTPRWSPDGRRIAYVSRGAVRLMAARTGRPVRRLIDTPSVSSLDWSPDGTRLLYASEACGQRKGLFVRRADGRGSLKRLTSAGARTVHGAVWSPDGHRIAFVTSAYENEVEQHSIWTMDARGTDRKRILVSDWVDSEGSMIPTLSWQPLPR